MRPKVLTSSRHHIITTTNQLILLLVKGDTTPWRQEWSWSKFAVFFSLLTHFANGWGHSNLSKCPFWWYICYLKANSSCQWSSKCHQQHFYRPFSIRREHSSRGDVMLYYIVLHHNYKLIFKKILAIFSLSPPLSVSLLCADYRLCLHKRCSSQIVFKVMTF